MVRINNLGQFLAIDQLFVDPHVDDGVEAVGCFHIVSDYFGNGGTPGERKDTFR